MKQLSVEELKELIQLTINEPISIIDVREVAEFQEHHLPQARNIPLTTLPEVMDELAKEQPHYVICQHGIRSEQACDFLQRQGFNVINVSDGMAGEK